MTKFPSVAVVILNWNGKKYLEKFLPSVLKCTYPNLEVIIADNASYDDSIDFILQNFPLVRIIENSLNLGFAGGYNEALKEVKSDYFILLNSDVEVEPDWIEPIIELMESDTKIAAAQPKIKDYNRKEYFEHAGAAGGFLDKYGYPFCRGRIFDTVEKDKGQYNKSGEIFWASGAAFFIKRKAWVEAGGFDSDFFAHMEEIDLCWRLRNSSYKIMYCSGSSVYHIGGGTLSKEDPKKTFLNFRNNLWMLQKNLPKDRVFKTIFIRFWLDFISIVKFSAEGKFKNAIAVSKAHFAFFGSLHRTNRKRKKLKNQETIGKGFYFKSIVWKYFIERVKTFNKL